MTDLEILYFYGQLLVPILVIWGLRAGLLRWAKSPPKELVDTATRAQLTPAEVAYLLRKGDVTHTIIVLIVDLMQRVSKQGNADTDSTDALSAKLQLHPYEEAVFQNVRGFMKGYAEKKVSYLVPVHELKSLKQWLLRAKALRLFFGETLREFIREFVADPWHIRKYISFTGVARLAVEVGTSSTRGAVEGSLQSELLARALLVSEQRRRRFALILLLLAPVALATIPACTFFSGYPWSLQTAIQSTTSLIVPFIGCAIPTALCLAASYITDLIPAWSEIAWIASEIPRKNWRFALVRTLLFLKRVIGLFLLLLLVTATTAILLIVLAPHRVSFDRDFGFAVTFVVTMMLQWYTCFRLLGDAHRLWFRVLPTQPAEQKVSEVKRRIQHTSPMKTLGQAFMDASYDPTFSQIIALYGIETLWLLG